MNELVQLIMQKTGLSQDKAQEIVNLVISHCKSNLPESVSSHLDGLLATLESPEAQGLLEKAKGLAAGFGSKA
jgi:nucleoid DNA-binding protein